MKTEGWLFDLYPKLGRMILWLKKRDGECVRLVDEWTPRIHIAGNFTDLLDLAARPELCDRYSFVEKFERPNDPSRSKVLEIKVSSDREAVALAQKIQRLAAYGSKYRPYDVDIPSSQMYLYQKGLFPLAYVEADNRDGRIVWHLLDSSESADYEIPPFRIAELAVSTKTSKRIPTMNDPIGTITITTEDKERQIDSDSETDKLLGLVETFNEFDPDIIRSDGGDSFIFPYLAQRANEHGMLHELVLGREHAPLQVFEVTGRSYFSYGRIYYRSTAARLMGRLHLDYSNSFIDNDCGLEGLIEVARTCIIPLQRASRSTIGTSMSSLQIYHAMKRGVLIPWNKSQPEDFKDGNRILLADRGGFIYEPKFGIHDSVGEVDFASVDYNEPIVVNESGQVIIRKIGEFVDSILNRRGRFVNHQVEIADTLEDALQVLAFDDNLKVRFVDLKQVSRKVAASRLLEIRTRSGRTIRITKGHSLFTYKDGAVHPTPGSMLKVRDYIVVPNAAVFPVFDRTQFNLMHALNQLPRDRIGDLVAEFPARLYRRKTIPRIRLLGEIVKSGGQVENSSLAHRLGQRHTSICSFLSKLETEGLVHRAYGKTSISELGCRYVEREARIISVARYCPARRKYQVELRYIIDALALEDDECFRDWSIGFGGCHHRVNAILPLIDLAKFLGYYVSEGSSTRSQRQGRKGRPYYVVDIAATDIFDNVVNCLRRLGFRHSTIVTQKGGRRYKIIALPSRIFHFLTTNLFECGEESHKKAVPSFLFLSDEATKLAFLEAYLEGDGSMESNARTFTTVSQRLVEGVALLLLSLGVKGISIHNYGNRFDVHINDDFLGVRRTKHYNYSFYVPAFLAPSKYLKTWNYEVVRQDHSQTVNRTRLLKWLCSKNMDSESSLKRFLESDLTLDRIVCIKEVDPSTKYVYDLGVSCRSQSFIAGFGWIAAHNSLYPTIMLKKNLSGETVNCECCLDSPNRVPEVGFHVCKRRQGIVPASLEVLLKKRAKYKRWKNEAKDPPTRARYDQRQAALKWILVCS